MSTIATLNLPSSMSGSWTVSAVPLDVHPVAAPGSARMLPRCCQGLLSPAARPPRSPARASATTHPASISYPPSVPRRARPRPALACPERTLPPSSVRIRVEGGGVFGRFRLGSRTVAGRASATGRDGGDAAREECLGRGRRTVGWWHDSTNTGGTAVPARHSGPPRHQDGGSFADGCPGATPSRSRRAIASVLVLLCHRARPRGRGVPLDHTGVGWRPARPRDPTDLERHAPVPPGGPCHHRDGLPGPPARRSAIESGPPHPQRGDPAPSGPLTGSSRSPWHACRCPRTSGRTRPGPARGRCSRTCPWRSRARRASHRRACRGW